MSVWVWLFLLMFVAWCCIMVYLHYPKLFKRRVTSYRPKIYPMQCTRCQRWRRDDEVVPPEGTVWTVMPEIWHGIGDEHICPECRREEHNKHPHCKSCDCEGKNKDLNPHFYS